MGAGKSTAIQCISEIPVINTDVRATDEVSLRKETTTVALDYGELTLADRQKISIYGTPGQERFNFMWEILAQGALGLIILIDNTAPDPLQELERYLDVFLEHIAENAIVIGVTRTDLKATPSLDAYHQRLAQRNLALPLFSIDARKREHIVMMIEALVAMLEYG